MGGPGDVGEQAGGEAQPGAARRRRRRPARSRRRAGRHAGRSGRARPRPRAPPRSADRARALGARQLVVEQALADAEAGDDQARRARARRPGRRAADWRWARSGSATARPSGMSRSAALSTLASTSCSSRGRSDRHVMLVGDRQRMIGQRHVEPGQRAPAAADQVEGPPAAGALEAGAGDRLGDLLGERASPFSASASRRSTPSGSEALRPTLPPATSTSSRLPPPRSPTMPSASGMAESTPCPALLPSSSPERMRGSKPSARDLGRGRRRRSRPRAPRRWRRCGCGPPSSGGPAGGSARARRARAPRACASIAPVSPTPGRGRPAPSR